MTDRNKQGPTLKAPQNQNKRDPEQEARMMVIQEKGEAILNIVEGLTFAEAGMVLKTCESMLNARVQKILNSTVITVITGETNG